MLRRPGPHHNLKDARLSDFHNQPGPAVDNCWQWAVPGGGVADGSATRGGSWAGRRWKFRPFEVASGPALPVRSRLRMSFWGRAAASALNYHILYDAFYNIEVIEMDDN